MYIADNPNTETTWQGKTGKTEWENYVQEWPTVPKGIKKSTEGTDTDLGGTNYTVTIDKDGTITVTPGKADENGEIKID